MLGAQCLTWTTFGVEYPWVSHVPRQLCRRRSVEKQRHDLTGTDGQSCIVLFNEASLSKTCVRSKNGWKDSLETYVATSTCSRDATLLVPLPRPHTSALSEQQYICDSTFASASKRARPHSPRSLLSPVSGASASNLPIFFSGVSLSTCFPRFATGISSAASRFFAFLPLLQVL
eukprot:6483904-Amphidinium_carterae.1